MVQDSIANYGVCGQ